VSRPSPHGAFPGSPQVKGPGLRGRVVVNTRAPHQAEKLSTLLARYGARTLLYPCIDIAPPADTAQLDRAVRAAAAGDFDWLVVTSANTARILADRSAALSVSLAGMRVAAVGPETATAVRDLLRIDAEKVATDYVAEALAAELQPVVGQRFFLPQSIIARPVLAETLRASGAEVTAVGAYQTVMGQGGDDVPAALTAGQVDAVTFTSSSTVRHFLQRLHEEGGRRADLQGVCLAAIGPVTAQTMMAEGLPVDIIPSPYTVSSLATALEGYFRA
jgi:uroporphyrinogen III methyltransferase / synthase